MTINLTTECISLIQNPDMSSWQLKLNLVMQVIVGAAAGYTMGWLILLVFGRLKLGYDSF